MCAIITCGDATRRRRYSDDPARRRWYATWRAKRFRRHYFGPDAERERVEEKA